MHYYSHNINDFNNATIHLSIEEECMYHRALSWYYSNEKPLPSDKAKIYRFLRATTKKLQTAVNNILDDFFTEESDGFHQSRCDSEIEEYKSKQAKAVEAGKASAEARRKSNPIKISVEQDSNDISADVQQANKQESNARSTPVQPTNNHKPITINQDKNNNTTTAGEKNFQVEPQPTFDIKNWQAPQYDEFLSVLAENNIYLKLSHDNYLTEVEKFKSYNANQVAQGKSPLLDENYRMAKFIDWFRFLAGKRVNTHVQPTTGDDDLPESFRQATSQGYHPSHSKPTTVKLDPKTSVFVNGLLKPCFEGMTQEQTYSYIAMHKEAGETDDETYDRLARECFGAVV